MLYQKMHNSPDSRTTVVRFRDLKTLEDFDWQFNPSIRKKQVYELASGHFIREARDSLWLGPPAPFSRMTGPGGWGPYEHVEYGPLQVACGRHRHSNRRTSRTSWFTTTRSEGNRW